MSSINLNPYNAPHTARFIYNPYPNSNQVYDRQTNQKANATLEEFLNGSFENGISFNEFFSRDLSSNQSYESESRLLTQFSNQSIVTDSPVVSLVGVSRLDDEIQSLSVTDSNVPEPSLLILYSLCSALMLRRFRR